jgi:hypothetical protein
MREAATDDGSTTHRGTHHTLTARPAAELAKATQAGAKRTAAAARDAPRATALQSSAAMRGAPVAWITGVVAAALLAFAFAVGAAAAPAVDVQAGTYRGTLHPPRTNITISLRVSAGGHGIAAISVSKLPSFCSGNGPPGTPRIRFAHAAISQTGRFSSIGDDVVSAHLPHPIVIAKLRVTGVFEAGGREHGVVRISYATGATHCDGHTAYSTRR